jgi:hypothetical protein
MFVEELAARIGLKMCFRFCEDKEAPEKRRYVNKPFVDYRIEVLLFERREE